MAENPKFSKETELLIEIALSEDLGSGDITSESLIPAEAPGEAVVLSREPLLVCGHPVAARVFERVDPAIRYTPVIPDGAHAGAEAVLAAVTGPLRSLLTAERTVLNFMQRLSGIATQTASLQALAGGVKLLDTRKTTPGMRELEKYAVRTGGGTNHRTGLFDMVLIKNNHIDAAGGDVAQAVRTARAKAPAGMKIDVEIRSEKELLQAIDAAPDIILLDNFSPEELTKLVVIARQRAPKIILEASGGIDENNLSQYAATGVDCISMGALTHSVRSADISFRLESVLHRYPR